MVYILCSIELHPSSKFGGCVFARCHRLIVCWQYPQGISDIRRSLLCMGIADPLLPAVHDLLQLRLLLVREQVLLGTQ